MATRRNININLSDHEHVELRHILLEEGTSMAEFFGRYARNYIAVKRSERHKPSAPAKAAEKPKRSHHSTIPP